MGVKSLILSIILLFLYCFDWIVPLWKNFNFNSVGLLVFVSYFCIVLSFLVQYNYKTLKKSPHLVFQLSTYIFIASVFFMYLIYTHILIIGYADIPQEVILWQSVLNTWGLYAVIILTFAVPFILFIFNKFRENNSILVIASISSICGHFLFNYILHLQNVNIFVIVCLVVVIVSIILFQQYHKSFLTVTNIFMSIFIFNLLSCVKSENSTGYTYMPDMTERYDTIPSIFHDTTNHGFTVFSNSSSRYLLRKTKTERALSSMVYSVPIPNDSTIAKGKVLYERNCMMCHGANFDGKGELFTSGKYLFPPADLTKETVKKIPDAELFHVLSVGFNLMKGQAVQLSPIERWNIIAYYRCKHPNPIQ
ncbi:MAG: cytochrome c [Bacteroidales bacterium]